MFGKSSTSEAVTENREVLVNAQQQLYDKLQEEGIMRDSVHNLATAYDFVERAANADSLDEQQKFVAHALDELDDYTDWYNDRLGVSEIVETLKRV